MLAYGLALLAVTLITAGQLCQKLGALRAARQRRPQHFVWLALIQPVTLLGIFFLVLGTIAWLGVLALMEVSKAFPLLACGYILVMVVSKFYLKENVSWVRWLGVACIVIGVSLLAQS
jgi:drug/metabolite transporter (DMT)-like permease